MKTRTPTIAPPLLGAPPRRRARTFLLAAAMLLLLLLARNTSFARSARWHHNPTSGDWNTADNWAPRTVPNGSADTATFGRSNTTAISISADTIVDGITFARGASSYTITASSTFTLTISGAGITNNSGVTQNFVTTVDGAGNFGQIFFTNRATAGTSIFTNNGSVANFARGGETAFFNTSTAANGTFVNNGGTGDRTGGGITEFYDSSTAGNANFTNKDGIGTSTSATVFYNTSTAANGFFTNDGAGTPGFVFAEGGQTIFFDTSTAANGTFTNNGATVSRGFGGATVFDDSSSAGNGIFTNNGGAASGVAALGGGATFFFGTSTAANGTFINNAATASGAEGGVTQFGLSFFNFSPSAGNGTFINNGATISGAVGGETVFYNTSTADAATLIGNGGINGGSGGAICFEEESTGGTSRIEVFGNGELDISAVISASPPNVPNVTFGSVEGSGNVFLGANNLTVGSNNLSTIFSGGISGAGGSLTKIGSGTLTFQGRATNNYIENTVSLSLVSGSIINLNFSGAPDTIRSLTVDGVAQVPGVYGSAASGAPHQLPEFAGMGTVQVTMLAASRKIHDAAGTFDVPLPLTGNVGIECRRGGANLDYQVVVTFASPVTVSTASVTGGTGSVSSATASGTTTLTVDLTGVTNAQTITITLADVNDGISTSDVAIPMSVLVGDTNGDGFVNAGDTLETRNRSGQVTNATNFYSDVNLDGFINSGDFTIVRARSGTFLP